MPSNPDKNMKLTSKMVISAMKKQKLIPIPDGFYKTVELDNKICHGGCPLGAIYGPDGPSWPLTPYQEGIASGFDGDTPDEEYRNYFYNTNDVKEFLQGFCDGVQIHLDALKAFGFLTKE